MQGGLIDAVRSLDGRRDSPLETEGYRIATGAYVTAAAPLAKVGAVTAHGDGVLRFLSGDNDPVEVQAHRGAVLAMALDGEDAVVTGGDDGRFLRIASDGQPDELDDFGSRWVDCVAAHAPAALRACSVGKEVYLWENGARRKEAFVHPSTVGGIAFDPKGHRMAVAHYGGVTLWERGRRRWRSRKLAWNGSHIGVTWSPDGKYVVSVMQENALHGWRLRDRADLRMSGYPGKPRVLDWVGSLPYLVTSGADRAVCWPFDGKTGPMGRGPLSVAHGGRQMATCVSAVPGEAAVLAGFYDGTVLLSELSEGAEDFVVREATGAEVTALEVTTSVSHVLIGDAAGEILWKPLRPWDGVFS